MKERGQDQWLQDYLDGRLSAEERARAEQRIREDEELTRRVEAWRKIGESLREDSAELSPGFYTRARARFEESVEPRPRLHRLFSWEAAGLAAVAVLAAALFVPEMMRSPDLATMPVPQTETIAPGERATRLAEGEPGKERAEPDADDFSPEPAGEAVSAGAEKAERAEPESDPPAGRDFAPSPKAKSAPRAPLPAVAPADAEEALAEGVSSYRVSSAVEASRQVVSLAQGVSIPDGARVADDRSTWEAWLNGPAGPALRQLGAYGPGRLLIVVGRPGGIDCSTLRVTSLPNEYRVAFDEGLGPAAGCAFVLPGPHGTSVVLESPESRIDR